MIWNRARARDRASSVRPVKEARPDSGSVDACGMSVHDTARISTGQRRRVTNSGAKGVTFTGELNSLFSPGFLSNWTHNPPSTTRYDVESPCVDQERWPRGSSEPGALVRSRVETAPK